MGRSSNKYDINVKQRDNVYRETQQNNESQKQRSFLGYKVIKQITFTGLWLTLVCIQF